MASNHTADAGGQPRRRRRPALSCLECRRRKIKCDQKNPCGRCTLKMLTCLFSPTAATTTPRNLQLEIGTLPPTPSSTNHASLDRTGNPRGVRSLNNTSNQFLMQASPETFPITEVPQLRRRPSLIRPAPGDPDTERTINCLVNRVQKLEQILSESSSKATANLGCVSAIESAAQQLRGTLSKTRFFGKSHWMTSFEHFYKLYSFTRLAEWDEIYTALQKCKDLGRAAKAQLPSRWLIPSDLTSFIPPQELANKLIHLYFRTFESVYRILHIPSFQREYADYWINPQAASSGFVIKLMLVLAIGTCLYQNPHDETDLRARALSWVYTAQSWLSAPFEKSRLNLSGLQVHCLLLLARQTNTVGSDLVWISAGSLLRTAIQMGLHRDPRHFPQMSVLHSELRRRLWATILEIATQSCIDSGMQPYISLDDFDTEPPSNINDDEVDESTNIPPPSKSSMVFTQTSLQIALLKSLRTRLEIVRLINNIHSEPPYDDILQLNAELVNACRDASILTQTQKDDSTVADRTPEPRPTIFHRNLVEHLLRRFLLTLHRPSALKARTDPHFHFSRKICLDSALSIISPEADDDFSRLMVTGGGLFREIISHGAFTVCLELIIQLEEFGSDKMTLQRTRASREPMIEAVRNILVLAEKRIEMSENNVNGHLFLSAALAQIDAMEAGTACDVAIFEAAKRSVGITYEILRARTAPAAVASQSDPHDRQEMDGESLGDGDGRDLGFDFLQDANIHFDVPESWLLSSWNEDFQT